MTTTFEIKEMPALRVITCAHRGDYSKICEAFQRLAAWAAPRGLMAGTPLMAAIYHDAPCSKPVDQLRSDACLVITEEVAVDDQMGKYTIHAGTFAVGHFEITMDQFAQVWNEVYEFLTAQGYKGGQGDHYELYLNNPESHPQGKWLVDICVPVTK